MARDAGAKKVYFASAAPEIRYPNVYGIDMPTAAELIAHEKSVDDVRKSIGVDWLIYQDLQDVYYAVNDAVMPGKPKIERFEDSVFTGDYIAGKISKAYLDELAELRSDSAKAKKRVFSGQGMMNELL